MLMKKPAILLLEPQQVIMSVVCRPEDFHRGRNYDSLLRMTQLKQFIHSKPIRYRYKVRKKLLSKTNKSNKLKQNLHLSGLSSFCTADGAGVCFLAVWAGVCFELYCGRHTQGQDKGLGQGPNVILDLAANAKLGLGSGLFLTTCSLHSLDLTSYHRCRLEGLAQCPRTVSTKSSSL
jgi:hypothetical protein